ncbi:tetratricopeptide repeat protein [Brevundimonas sp. TWP2-3-4b1]|uniref:tetratricopeptide repeat protein n=1 Tax=Brevundimonas sp. TWP2-3-4b1 TaxID=2804580 RepID=UPI003CEF75B3
MSRTRASSSIALIALTLVGGLALTGPASAQTGQAAAPRVAATAEQRAAYGRLDPLARSVFWSREVEVNPADPVAGVKLAEALRQLGQHEQAATVAQQVLVTQPQNVDAMLEIGRAHIARGQAFYGIAALEQAKALAPGDWRPLSLLGVAYQQVRRVEDARAAWNEALRLSPDNAEVMNNAAMAQMTGGDPAGAETLLRRAVAQPNASLQMRLNLAMALGLQGRIPEAEQIIRRDLPPEAAERNLEWLRNQVRPATAGVETDTASPALVRTWSSLQGQ